MAGEQKKLDEYIKKNGIDALFSNYEAYKPYFSLMEFPKRTYIYSNDYNERYLYFFVKGRFKVYGNLSNGKRILFRFCSAFMLMGEMEFLMGEQRLEETNVEAVEDCVVVALDYHDIREQLENDTKFLHCLLQTMAEKISYFGNMEMVNNLHTAEGRVAVYLLNSVKGTGIFSENQRIVAEQLNISYRHLHRVLQKFVDSGYLARMNHSYRVLDREGLKKCAAEQ